MAGWSCPGAICCQSAASGVGAMPYLNALIQRSILNLCRICIGESEEGWPHGKVAETGAES